jgi:hypothetical protein
VVRRGLALFAAVAFSWGCAAIAGLEDFVPADGGASSTGGSAPIGGGGDGGAAAGGMSAGGAGGDDGCAVDLIVSEIRTYGTGAGDDDFVELYNPTSATISLDDVALAARPPGGGTLDERWRGGSGDELGPLQRVLIAGAGFDDPGAPAAFGTLVPSLGNDTILVLTRGAPGVGDTIDVVCVCTQGCGSAEWNGCQGVLANPAYQAGDIVDVDDSLQRLPDCLDTNSASDFQAGLPTAGDANDP